MTTRRVWADHITHFTTYRVITTDLRGHGDTGATRVAKYDYTCFVEDLAALVASIDGHPVLAGCSLGAQTALLYARHAPATVTGVVAAGVAPQTGVMQYLAPLIARVERAATRVVGRERLSRVLPLPDIADSEYWKLAELLDGDDETVWDERSLASLLGETDVPVTLVRGPSEGRFATRAVNLDHVTVEPLPKGGHLAALRCPAEFATVVERNARSSTES